MKKDIWYVTVENPDLEQIAQEYEHYFKLEEEEFVGPYPQLHCVCAWVGGEDPELTDGCYDDPKRAFLRKEELNWEIRHGVALPPVGLPY